MFEEVAQALDRHNPDGQYTFSLCIWGSADVRSWAAKVGNLSRTSEDITPQWSRMLHNMDTAARRELYAHPGSWNDPDMLFIGSGEFDAAHMTEARSHFSMWAMLNAPLIIGFDLRKANAEQLAVLGNSAIIALNQDLADIRPSWLMIPTICKSTSRRWRTATRRLPSSIGPAPRSKRT